MTIHGISKSYLIEGTFEYRGVHVVASAEFNVGLADHKITIPKLVFKEITRSVRVNVESVYTLKLPGLPEDPG